MVVIKIGETRYAISEPAERNGEYEVSMTMDGKFVFLAGFAS
jgi:hypothetical protein